MKTLKEYKLALKKLEKLLDADPDPKSSKGKRLNKLADEIQAFEKIRWSIVQLPSPATRK